MLPSETLSCLSYRDDVFVFVKGRWRWQLEIVDHRRPRRVGIAVPAVRQLRLTPVGADGMPSTITPRKKTLGFPTGIVYDGATGWKSLTTDSREGFADSESTPGTEERRNEAAVFDR